MKTPTLFAAGIVASSLCFGSTATLAQDATDSADEVPRFQQDEFALGFWVDPPADANMEQAYKEIAEANFNLVIGGFAGRGTEFLNRQLELCKKHDLVALVDIRGLEPEEYPDHPNCWGYLLTDEPSAARFSELGEWVSAIREIRPGMLSYINLYPTYASAQQLGVPTYDEHVRRFVEIVDTDVLSTNHYPDFHRGERRRDEYIRNLESMRQHSMEADIPFWNFFKAMPFDALMDPTEAQMRWQIYSSLAFGAKGVMYFCYFTPTSPSFPEGGALVTREGRLTRKYYQAQRINHAIQNLGPTLMELESTGAFRMKPEGDFYYVRPDGEFGEGRIFGSLDDRTRAGIPIRSVKASKEKALPADLLIGTFIFPDGRRAVMINNYRYAYTSWLTVEFDADPAEVLEVSQETGELEPVIDDSPAMEGLQISLPAGGGRLFVLPPAS
ncbi:hypothetical protein ACERK3_07195 [Phycisphaerales bacterium AB-hyl4]|uniref:Beta-galactosidase-like protein n=1 Tax=Natronomicrosphaera hydrolytica TaxID=3242702 RepID=A0ABV4U3B1_9BACT